MAPCGLALLFALPCIADDSLREAVRQQMRDESYVLLEDKNGARLFVFSSDAGDRGTVLTLPLASPGSAADALAKTRSADMRTRVRGLTELSGMDDDEALNAALVLLSDPEEVVREEAIQLIMEHPDADIDNFVAIALSDSSPRVHEAVQDLIDEEPVGGEGGD